MPSKSKAQFKKMAILHEQGKITDKQFQDFDGPGVSYKSLPGHVAGSDARRPPPRKRGSK
jgi:hypothetical protein